jgi:hypothetical protein
VVGPPKTKPLYSTDPASDGYVLTPEGTTVRKPAGDDD